MDLSRVWYGISIIGLCCSLPAMTHAQPITDATQSNEPGFKFLTGAGDVHLAGQERPADARTGLAKDNIPDRSQRPDRVEKAQRSERTERPARPKRPERSEHAGR